MDIGGALSRTLRVEIEFAEENEVKKGPNELCEILCRTEDGNSGLEVIKSPVTRAFPYVLFRCAAL